MRRNGCFQRKRWAAIALATCALAAPSRSALAAVAHRYTFNDGTAKDAVDLSGFSDGALAGVGGTFTGGTLDLTFNNNHVGTAGAYLDLPNNIFSNSVNGGTVGQASLEIWINTSVNRNWSEAYSFGTSNNGEDNTNGGGSTSGYVALIPRSGVATPDYRSTTHAPNNTEVALIGSATPLSTGVKHHIVFTFDQFDTNGGVNLNGTARMYTDNSAPIVAGIAYDISLATDVNNWLGRSQWNDPNYDGFIDEFRIWDTAMTAGEVATSFTTGPVPSPTPTLVIDRTTGGMSIGNQTTATIQLKAYSIASAGGALNPITWTSIDADNTFDTNGVWTKSSMTNLLLTEAVTSGTLDGGPLAASASRSIGTPWRKSPTEDVTFSYTLGDGTMGTGFVQYTGNNGAAFARSDLNGDGTITTADWGLFLPNAFTTFASETTVGAYLKGDLDGDKDNDYSDFLLFKADYLAANPGASVADLVGIPEPGSLALAGVAAIGLFAGRSRRRVA